MINNILKKIPAKEEIPIKSFSIAAFICRKKNNKGKYLIIRRSRQYLKGNWQMVSGKIEKGETAWQAALREIKEETGLIPDRLYSTNKVECFYEVHQNCINIIPVFVAFVETEGNVKLSKDEHDEYKWITIDQITDFIVFQNQIEHMKYIEENFIKKEPFEFLQIKTKTGQCQ
jgi:dATP pyrophosphohydrolase